MYLKLFMMWKNIFVFFLKYVLGNEYNFLIYENCIKNKNLKSGNFNYRFWDIWNLILLLYKILLIREEYVYL